MKKRSVLVNCRLLILLVILSGLFTEHTFPSTTIAVVVEFPRQLHPGNVSPTVAELPWQSMTLTHIPPDTGIDHALSHIITDLGTAPAVIYHQNHLHLMATESAPIETAKAWTVTVHHEHPLTAHCITGLAVKVLHSPPGSAEISLAVPNSSAHPAIATANSYWSATIETTIRQSTRRYLVSSDNRFHPSAGNIWRIYPVPLSPVKRLVNSPDPLEELTKMLDEMLLFSPRPNPPVIPFPHPATTRKTYSLHPFASHRRQNAIDDTYVPQKSLKRDTEHYRRRLLVPCRPPSDLPGEASHYRQSSVGIIKDEHSYPTRLQLVHCGIPRLDNIYSWTIQCILGAGSYGSVVLARKNNMAMAIKRAKSGTKLAFHLQREAGFLNKLRHKCIIGIQGIAQVMVKGKIEDSDKDVKNYSAQEFWMGLDYKTGGTLWNFIKKHPEWLTRAFNRNVMRRITQGTAWAHRTGIVHRDIKPDNILLDWPTQTFQSLDNMIIWISNTAVLSDFGLGSPIEEQELTQKTGTISYRAPELIRPETRSYKPREADSWSLGATAFAVYIKDDPYWHWHHFRNQEELACIRNRKHFKELGTQEMLNSLHANRNAEDFIAKCCTMNPLDRPTPEQLQDHPWFSSDTHTATNSGNQTLKRKKR